MRVILSAITILFVQSVLAVPGQTRTPVEVPSTRSSIPRNWFVGANLGVISTNSSVGSFSRDSQMSYGLTTFYNLNKFAVGLDYNYFKKNESGTSVVRVSSTNHMIGASGRYILMQKFAQPYITIGTGTYLRNVSTEVFGVNESQTGIDLMTTAGVGLWGRFTTHLGMDLSMKYYQFGSNSGFMYLVSLGYLP